ncbi:hypothetical protein Trydic_g11366 [Trypoxylus dichotomus]
MKVLALPFLSIHPPFQSTVEVLAVVHTPNNTLTMNHFVEPSAITTTYVPVSLVIVGCTGKVEEKRMDLVYMSRTKAGQRPYKVTSIQPFGSFLLPFERRIL